jgi:hypothetical protein
LSAFVQIRQSQQPVLGVGGLRAPNTAFPVHPTSDKFQPVSHHQNR